MDIVKFFEHNTAGQWKINHFAPQPIAIAADPVHADSAEHKTSDLIIQGSQRRPAFTDAEF